MPVTAFISAVSDEFHHPDPEGIRAFQSYRQVLRQSIRILVRDADARTQEDLVQGLGDLLTTLEDEVRCCHVVVHLVGDMAGAQPKPSEVRRLRERNQEWFSGEPELANLIGDGSGISYTQWEVYLAFLHQRGRLVFLADERAPRSPRFRRDEPGTSSQQQHVARIKATGEHYDLCYNQEDLARKVVASIERYGMLPGAPPPSTPAVLAAEKTLGPKLVAEIGQALRAESKSAIAEEDPAGIELLLRCVSTAALNAELNRRSAFSVVGDYRDELRTSVANDPAPESLRDLALAELAMGHYIEAMLAAERLAGEQLRIYRSQPVGTSSARESVINAYLLMHEAARLANRRDAAISALENAAQLVRVEEEPVLWADLQERLAAYLLDHSLYDRAANLIDEVLDIREDHHSKGDRALPATLIQWCRLLMARGRYQDVTAVAGRACRLMQEESPVDATRLAAAMSMQASGFDELGLLIEAERLTRQALAINTKELGPTDPVVAINLTNLAGILQATNRMREAEACMKQALQIDRMSFGSDHPKIAADFNNLGHLLKTMNRLDEAEQLLHESLRITEAVFGSDHPNVATCLNNLASIMKDTARNTEAEALFARALEIDEATYGPQHTSVGRDLLNLAGPLRFLGRTSEAEEHLRRALDIFKNKHGIDHPYVAITLNNLALLLQDLERYVEAEPLMRQHVEILFQFSCDTGYKHAHLDEALGNYELLLQDMGKTGDEIGHTIGDLLALYSYLAPGVFDFN